MSKDFYNGCLNDLLNASTEAEFVRLFDTHQDEFTHSKQASGWQNQSEMLMICVCEHNWLNAAKRIGDWMQHEMWFVGVAHASSMEMVQAVLPSDFQTIESQSRHSDGVRFLVDVPLTPTLREFFQSLHYPLSVREAVHRAASQQKMEHLLLLEKQMNKEFKLHVMFYAFRTGGVAMAEHFYNKNDAEQVLRYYERNKPNNSNYVAVENYLTQRLKAEAQANVLGAQVGGVLSVPGKPSKM